MKKAEGQGIMSAKARDNLIYSFAIDWLRNLQDVPRELYKKYLDPLSMYAKPKTVNGLYQRILESAQNANMKSGVIGKAIGGVENLRSVLNGFNPGRVLHGYSDWKTVFYRIKTDVKPAGQMRMTSRSIWPQYCRTILSAAKFMTQFKSANEFYRWVDFFDKDKRARPSLPLLLSKEIDGFGFALSCDFLKELGYVNFPKPDVHLRDIFVGIGLCGKKADDYGLCKAIVDFAENVGDTPYSVDKVFWLIGSGFFYDNPEIGKNGRIPNRKWDFVKKAKKRFGYL